MELSWCGLGLALGFCPYDSNESVDEFAYMGACVAFAYTDAIR